MNRVIFVIDQDLDFKNHLIGAEVSKNAQGIPPDAVAYYQDLREAGADQGKRLFQEKTSKFYSVEMKNIRSLIEKQTQEMWNLIEDDFIKKIETIHDKKFPFGKIYGVLTTAPFGYGYDFNEQGPWFACSKDSPLKAVHTAMHELMHAFFHVYFLEKCKKDLALQDKQIFDLKESLTVLLNLEFDDLRMYTDTGHPGHRTLREKVSTSWLKHHNINKVLEEIATEVKATPEK